MSSTNNIIVMACMFWGLIICHWTWRPQLYRKNYGHLRRDDSSQGREDQFIIQCLELFLCRVEAS